MHGKGELSVLIHIDPDASIPPFEQLRAGLVAAISDGRLPAEHRLPTVRAFAAELNLAPGTVAKTYRELEATGFIQTRGRAGTFVAAQGDPAAQRAQLAAAAYAAEIRALGVSPEAAVDYLRRALDG